MFDDHYRVIPVEQIAGPMCAVRIGWGPVLRAHLIKLQAQKGIKQVLKIILIVDFECGTIFFSEPELARDEVKSGADPP